jgi:serine/threonine-protein phosphatase PGAM5
MLVRHGQYDLENGGKLTKLGREQADVTGRWISEHLGESRVDALWSSTLPRARETAEIIAQSVRQSKVRPASVLCEGMYSKVKGYDVSASERQEDRERADAAYDRFFRASRADRLEIVVCHGNLIRYLICRAIDVPVGRWTRMNSHHCSLTRVLVRDTGAVRVVSYNETAHLPPVMVT